jgi:hypothetical protein
VLAAFRRYRRPSTPATAIEWTTSGVVVHESACACLWRIVLSGQQSARPDGADRVRACPMLDGRPGPEEMSSPTYGFREVRDVPTPVAHELPVPQAEARSDLGCGHQIGRLAHAHSATGELFATRSSLSRCPGVRVQARTPIVAGGRPPRSRSIAELGKYGNAFLMDLSSLFRWDGRGCRQRRRARGAEAERSQGRNWARRW